MKNNKTLRQILTAVIIAAAIGVIVMTVKFCFVNETVLDTPTLFSSITWMWKVTKDTSLVINWGLAGYYLTLLVIMLLAVVAKMVFVGIPTFKQTKNAAPMVIDALAIVCAIIAIVGLFLPTVFSAKNAAEKGASYVLNMVRAALALLNIGAPMVLAGTVVNSVIAFKESK